jgi:hypothetical protein
MVAPNFKSGRKKKRFKALVTLASGPEDPPGRETDGGVNCPVVIDPMVFVAPVLNILMPSEFVRFRSTLAKRTFNRIC